MFLNSVRYKLSLLMTLILTLPNPCFRERQKHLGKSVKFFMRQNFCFLCLLIARHGRMI